MVVRAIPADGGVGEVIDELSKMLDAGRKDDALAAMRTMLEAVVRENEQQRRKIAELLRRVYGPSAEKVDPRQLKLAMEQMRAEAQPPPPAAEPEAKLPDDPPKPPRNRSAKERRHGRRKLPADLPREEIRLFPTDQQLEGKGTMTKVSEERSEVLEYEPAKFKVIVYIRETWSDIKGQIVTAPVPNKVIAKGLPGPGLLTQITLSKFEDHCVPRRHAQQPKGRRCGLCCIEDEGRPLGIGVQARVPNHHELRESRARVVSVVGKGADRPRQVRSMETSASEPLMTCREESTQRRNRAEWLARDEPRGSLQTGWAAFGMQAA